MSDFLAELKASAAGLEEVEDTLEGVTGAKVLGNLTDEQVHEYVSLANLETDLAWLRDTLMRRHVQRSVDGLVGTKGSMLNMDFGELLTLSNQHSFFENEQEATYAFKMLAEFEHRNAEFWFKLRDSLNCWTRFLSIRKGWRVVDVGPKYK
jgi:hypothetical protein